MKNTNWKKEFDELLCYNSGQYERFLELLKIACKEQKKICAENAFISPKEIRIDDCDFDIDKDSILNAPTVKFYNMNETYYKCIECKKGPCFIQTIRKNPLESFKDICKIGLNSKWKKITKKQYDEGHKSNKVKL